MIDLPSIDPFENVREDGVWNGGGTEVTALNGLRVTMSFSTWASVKTLVSEPWGSGDEKFLCVLERVENENSDAAAESGVLITEVSTRVGSAVILP